MVAVTQTGLTIVGGQSVTPKVLVSDAAGLPVAGASVTFTVTGGTLSASSVTTGADGTASVTWTPEAVSSEQSLTATLGAFTQPFIVDVVTSLAGTWSGTGSGVTATMTIQHNVTAGTNATIQGAGTIDFGGKVQSAFVSGGAGGPTFVVTFTWTQINQPISVNFSGTVKSKDTVLSGAINGAGFVDVPFTMTKQ